MNIIPHSPSRHSLREALNYRGCLICYVLEKYENDWMAYFQYQILTNEKVRQDLIASNGYCNDHFYVMSRLSSPIVNAILTRGLIERDMGEIDKGSFESKRAIHCPACQEMKEQEDFYLKELKNFLSDEAFQKEYEGTDGLCQIHLRKMLNSIDEGLSQFLLKTQGIQLRRLKDELEAFISKVRSTSRDMKEEKNSWWIAIEKLVGKKGLRE